MKPDEVRPRLTLRPDALTSCLRPEHCPISEDHDPGHDLTPLVTVINEFSLRNPSPGSHQGARC